MIVLIYAAGASVTFAAVWFVWQGRRVWLFVHPAPQRTTVSCSVVRPIQSPAPVASSQRGALLGLRIWGEIEPPQP